MSNNSLCDCKSLSQAAGLYHHIHSVSHCVHSISQYTSTGRTCSQGIGNATGMIINDSHQLFGLFNQPTVCAFEIGILINFLIFSRQPHQHPFRKKTFAFSDYLTF